MLSPAVAIVGPTATGKSAVALEVARRVPDLEIVSADAFVVYRGMDIGTAKPTVAERREIPHHLVDVVDASEEYSLSRFVADGRPALTDIAAWGRRAVVVGGTGLYVRGLLDQLDVPGQWPDVRAELDDEPNTAALHARLERLDPIAAARMEPTNRRRVVRALEVTLGSSRTFSSYGEGLATYPAIPTVQIGVDLDVDELDIRIAARVDSMVVGGFVDEVRGLVDAGLSRTAAQGVGYKQLADHLADRCSLEEAIAETVRGTRRLARRQRRWFRRDPRITWRRPDTVPDEIARLLESS